MKAALIGCGFICHQHLRALARLREVEVVAVCDRDAGKAAKVAATYRIAHRHDDARAMLQTLRPDVVHVLTPPASHAGVAALAFAEGAHVLIEKPMALDAGQARTMIDQARQARRQLGICHNYLFVPAVQKARRWIAEGRIGELLSADIHWRMSTFDSASRPAAMAWMEALDGGPFHEVLAHPVYLIEALLGRARPQAVSVDRTDRPRQLCVLLAGARAPAQITVSLASRPVRKSMRIFGSEATIEIDLATGIAVRLSASGDGTVDRAMVNLQAGGQIIAGTLTNALRLASGRLRRGHENWLRESYRALVGGTTLPTTGEDGLQTIETLDATFRMFAKARAHGAGGVAAVPLDAG